MAAQDPIAAAWRAALAPKDLRSIPEWAAENVLHMPAVLSRDGCEAFRIGNSTHFMEPFAAIADDRVREVNVCAPPRSGKTLLADISIPWFIAVQGASVLFVIQTEAMAGSHAELRTMPLLKSVPAIAGMLPMNRHKERSNEIIFSNGLPLIVCGPSIANLQNRGFRVVIIDEAWRIAEDHPGRITEAKTRVRDFLREMNSKVMVISQGGSVGDDWHTQFSSGVLHEWEVPCLGCGVMFAPKIHGKHADGRRWGLVWDSREREDGRFDRAHALATLRYECPHCAHRHEDTPATKNAWSARGAYRCADPAADLTKKSFRWENSIDFPWHELAADWLAAREAAHFGVEGSTVQYFQKQCADFYDPSHGAHVESLPTSEVTPDAEGKKFWDKQDHIFLTIDMQLGHFWGLVEAWSKDGESMVLWADRLETWSDVTAKQEEFSVKDWNVFVDYGNWQSEVWAECAAHGKPGPGPSWWLRWRCWWALWGTDSPSFTFTRPVAGKPVTDRLPYSWPPEKGDPCFGEHRDSEKRKRLGGKICPTLRWSNPTIKDIMGRRRDLMMKKQLAYVAPGVSEHFARHIFAESKVPDPKNPGRLKWKPIGKRPNHLWDCWCMSAVAASMGKLIRVELR